MWFAHPLNIVSLYYLIEILPNIGICLIYYGKLSNKLYHKKGSKTFVDINSLTYPRANETLREIHRESWLKYYECLKQKYAVIGPERTIYPTAMMAYEGTFVSLKCQICVSPSEEYVLEEIEWYFNSSSNQSMFDQLVEYSEHVLLSHDGQSLLIYNIQLDQAGQYWCRMGDNIEAPYYLDVDKSLESLRTVYPEQSPATPHQTLPRIVPEYGVKVYTAWTKWSECSTCDIVGKKTRYGYCTISLINNLAHRYIMNESAPIIGKHLHRKREDFAANEDSKSTLQSILSVFKNKLPCKSKYIPKDVREIPAIRNRSTELMIRYCKIACPRNIVFEVRDIRGNVLESANNSAGIYSMVQGMPDVPPSITRLTLYRKHDMRVELICPGNLNSDTPIVWKIGTKTIIPTIIKKQSSGRVSIDARMHIVFKHLRFADENIYSCWQNNELAGTIRLRVTQEIDLRVNHIIVMIGCIAIILVFLKVFWKAFRGRKRYTIH